MLKKPISFETSFGTYTATEILGQGGAGTVYGGTDPDDSPIAVKLLSGERISRDKRKQFQNEIAFLSQAKHSNIVRVLDHGLHVPNGSNTSQPFYVMPRYTENLRACIGAGLAPDAVFRLFSQLLNGVEAAHLSGVVHRDLKPENILVDRQKNLVAIADFGVAAFTDELLITLVETQANQRLANFQYAAPEQRSRGKIVGPPADIYALGLMLNELFTGDVPHGTGFKQIGSVAADYAFLDDIVSSMMRQNPADRPESIAVLKASIEKFKAEAITIQKIDRITNTVIPEGAIDDPLAFEPPKLVGAEWDNDQLTLTLDRSVSQGWVLALHNMGNYSSVLGVDPQRFSFSGAKASVRCQEHAAQPVIDHFKQWLPRATEVYRARLEREADNKRRERLEKLRIEKEAEERRLRVNRSLKV